MASRIDIDLDRARVDHIDAARTLLGEPTRATIMWIAVVDCARIARHPDEAVRDLLPAYRSTSATPDSPPVKVKWTQSRAHYEACRVAIEDAGSTVTDALRWWVDQLHAAGGDPVALDLSLKRAHLVAA